MTGLQQWLQQLDFSYVLSLGMSALAALLCICVHESAHGLAAYWMGDPTAKNAGRITLNPLRHVDLVGLVLLAVAHVGWAKPVPVDMRRFKNPKRGMVLTAAAGPLSNLLLAVITGFFCVLCYFGYSESGGTAVYYFYLFFFYATTINCGLALFNLIPISPLDGSKVLLALLPQRLYARLMRVERYGMILLVILVWVGFFDGFLSQGIDAICNWILRLVWAPAAALYQIFV